MAPRGGPLIDEELLQELLAKASGLYNNGDYRGAIAAWKEVLAEDPSSQKAREGIQMATLLLGDFDPASPGDDSAVEPVPAADGAPAVPTGLPPAQRVARLDEGIARVRALLTERKFGEAVAGARSLVPIDPESGEVQRLVEEAQQAFEAAPFIEEHLTLAKELATGERFDEAIAECRKIFTLDPANPDGLALMRALKERVAALDTGDPGGATMRIDRADLAMLQGDPKAAASDDDGTAAVSTAAAEPVDEITFDDIPAPVTFDAADPVVVADAPNAPGDAEATAAALPDQMPDDLMNIDLSDEGAGPGVDGAAASGPLAAEPESSRSAEAVARAIVPPPAEAPAPEPFVGADLEAELGLEENAAAPAHAIPVAAPDEPIDMVEEMIAEQAAAAEPSAPADEVVDAETVVAPAVRRVPRDVKSPSVEEFLAGADKAESIPLAHPPAKPSAPKAGAAGSSSTVYTKTPDPGWEAELESLNMKSGEHDLVGHAAARNPTMAGEAGDVDLSSLLGDEMGDLQAGGPPAAPAETAAPARAPRAESGPAAPPALDEPAPSVDALLEATSPQIAMQAPARRQRARVSIPPVMFAGLGFVILAAAAGVWWFVYQPRNAAAQVAPPPSGNPPADRAEADRSTGPIPTPMASTSRQPSASAAGQADAGEGPQSGEGAAATAPGAAPAAADAAVVETGAPANAPPVVTSTPAPRPVRSPAEIRAEVVQRMANGRRFQSESKWQEARGEFAAALALDPVNFECKELLDQMQAKVDEDTKVRAGLDEAKRAFADKDYQGALWKLYRLPRDPRLGNIDLYIRNAWFNWAIVGLKGGDATDAKQKLNEVLQADAGDADAEKLMEVAEKYSARAKDRVYYSYVDSLRYRSFDQK